MVTESTWWDEVGLCNEEARRQISLKTLDLIIKESRLRWFGRDVC